MVPHDIQQQAAHALDELQAGRCAHALAITDQILATGADDAPLRCLRANALLRMGQAHEALEEAQAAVRLGPRNAACHLALGWAAWEAERWPTAKKALEAAVRWSNRDAIILIEYARFMACCGGPRPAWHAAREAVDANQESAAAWATLALAQYRRHRRQEAEASIARALKLDPNDLLAQSLMMTFFEAKGETAKAAALVRLMRDTPGGDRLAASFHERQRERHALQQLALSERTRHASLKRQPRPRRRLMKLCLVLIPPLMATAAAPAGIFASLVALITFSYVCWRLWPYAP